MPIEYTPNEKERKVIEIIKKEKTEWEDGVVWVTDKVNYKMKELIQKYRKNYLGKFDNETDPNTNKKKVFVPFTEDMVEAVVKNIDLDSVDINITATNPNGHSSASIIRYLVSHFMRKNNFGELLNEMIRVFCIDGTVVSKIMKNYDKKIQGQSIKTKIVDITNIFIDPSEDNIQDAGAVIERHVMKLSEVDEYPWDNKESIKGFKDITKINTFNTISYNSTGEVPYVEVYERWGDLPKFCFTGKEEDLDVWVPAMAIVSNIDRHAVVHKIIENKKRIKPYEEARYRKLFGRWYGRGIGEMLAGLQSYLNEVINLRLNKSRISQIGLFKYRKGSGITQQMLQSLISGGSIPVTRMDDIQELNISDVQPSSYQDENNIYTWGQRTTGAFSAGRGENLPASMPATTAVIQERGVRSGMELLQETLGLFLSRMFERHIIPLILETIKDEEIIAIVGSPKELKEIDENYINNISNKETLNHLIKYGCFPKADFIENLKNLFRGNLEQLKKTRYFKIDKKMFENWHYEVKVDVTGEAFNKAVMVQQLNEMMLNYSQIPGANLDVDALMKEMLDLMGIGGARFITNEKDRTQAPVSQPPKSTPMQSETEMTAQQGTFERAGAGGAPTL
jgi:hypothetical protein